MSEEKEPGFFAQIKNQIIAGVGIAMTALGTMFVDEVKSIVGIEDEEAAPTEQVQGVQQSVNVSGPEIVINIPEQKKDTVVKVIKEKAPVKKKEKEEKIDW